MNFTDPARLIHQFTQAAVIDDNGIKTAIATATSAVVYSGADLNGAFISISDWRLPRGLSVKTSASVGSFNTTDPIVYTGVDWFGDVATATAYLTSANGNEVVATPEGLCGVTSIAVPEQNDTSGQFEFGVRDIVLDQQNSAGRYVLHGRELVWGADGDILVGLIGDSLVADPTVASRYRETLTGVESQSLPFFFTRVYGLASTTAWPLTILI